MLSQSLTGTLVRQSCPVRGEDLEKIAGLPNPPLAGLGADDIYVRRCRLANDQVDGRFGRFREVDMPRLLEMVHGAPVLIGAPQSLGIARFFGGEIEKRGDVTWIIPRFYWLRRAHPRAHPSAEDLRVMIDSGRYSVASIAFRYTTPTCSVCGMDMRRCAHWPGRTYDGTLCYYWYDGPLESKRFE